MTSKFFTFTFPFATAFALVGLASIVAPGCSSEDCGQATPTRPEPQPPVSVDVTSFDESGNATTLELDPENATMEVTGDKVVILYRQGTVDYRVEYQVMGPR